MTHGVSDTSQVSPKTSIVCFSHLGWDSRLFQRPQQIMSRLAAAGWPVYYFACVGRRRHKAAPMAGPLVGAPGVYVYTVPYAPGVTRFAGVRRWAAGLRIAGTLARNGVHNPVLWFYHPSLFALGYSKSDTAIVYDIMDHFPSFENSIDDAYFDELTLLAEADMVFTGGRSLDRHARQMVDVLLQTPDQAGPTATPNATASIGPIHCFPSGVDLEHFAGGFPKGAAKESLSKLPAPRFGYCGAIDERIDWEVISALASKTHGSVIMIGPVLGNVPHELPENVHLPGPEDYQKLPAVVAAFDVCLIPFRNSPLVQFVSPTKTPEYLAAGRPVVSTAIPDVVTDYGDVVRIAASPEEFANACIELAATPADCDALVSEARRRARTWDQIAQQMEELLAQLIPGEAYPRR